MSQSSSTSSQPSEILDFATALRNTSDGSTLHSVHDETHGNKEDALTGGLDNIRPPLGQPNDVETSFNSDITTSALDIPRVTTNALAAIQSEHGMTFRQGMRLYPKAVFWSAMISLAIVMEGFQTALISSFFAFPQFQKAYGVPSGDGRYEITTGWQILLSNGSVVGAIIGLLGNGPFTEWIGYRYTMMGALVTLAGFIFLTFFAFSRGVLLAGQILCGLSWGVFSTLTTTYAAEVMPLNLRGYLTANVNLCWLVGQIIALGTLRGVLSMQSDWSFRIPFGVQWVWIIIVFIVVVFAPESPWYLVRKGRLDQARHALNRLTRQNMGFNVENTIEMMQHTDAVEKKLNDGKGRRNDLSYKECFRGTNLRRTEIACMMFVSQVFSGLPLSTFAAYFFSEIGLGEEVSFDLTVGMYGLAILGAFLSLALLKFIGRRTLYLAGLSGMLVVLLLIGVIGCLEETTARLWTMAGLELLLIFIFDATIGPLTYVLVAELPSTRLRINTVVLARISYNLCSLVTNVITNYTLNQLAWNWGGKSCFLWAGTNLLCLFYCYWRLPETKGLSYHELDILFEKKVPARKFKRVRKRLEETGYFGFYDQGHPQEQAAWHI